MGTGTKQNKQTKKRKTTLQIPVAISTKKCEKHHTNQPLNNLIRYLNKILSKP